MDCISGTYCSTTLATSKTKKSKRSPRPLRRQCGAQPAPEEAGAARDNASVDDVVSENKATPNDQSLARDWTRLKRNIQRRALADSSSELLLYIIIF